MILRSIETERLVLGSLRVGDAGEMVSVLADASLYEFTGGEPPTVSSLADRYRHQTAGSSEPGEFWCNWIIRTRIDGRAVGFVQATVVGRSADVAWVVGVSDQGRGHATEAVRAACEWLTENDVGRIEAHIHPRHVASQTVAARVGLVRTGEFDGDGEEVWAAGDAAGSLDQSDAAAKPNTMAMPAPPSPPSSNRHLMATGDRATPTTPLCGPATAPRRTRRRFA